MTDDNSNLVDMDDLNNFEDVFYGRKEEPEAQPEAEDTKEEEVAETESDELETSEDTDAPEGDEEAEDKEETAEEQPQPQKRPRKSAKERIDELTAEKYELRRSYESRLIEMQQALEAVRKPEAVQQQRATSELPAGAPSPDAVDQNGNPIYPLGEFDKNFVADISRFAAAQEIEAREREAAQRAYIQQVTEAQNQLKTHYGTKLQEFEKEIPDARQDIQELVDVLGNINPQYGEYLAMTVMSCENGPQIMHYLSQNIGEAQNIVASGPSAATLAIGRLDDKLSRQRDSEKRNIRVSEAPKPPASASKGRGARTTVRDDTDDLDAFSKKFFRS